MQPEARRRRAARRPRRVHKPSPWGPNTQSWANCPGSRAFPAHSVRHPGRPASTTSGAVGREHRERESASPPFRSSPHSSAALSASSRELPTTARPPVSRARWGTSGGPFRSPMSRLRQPLDPDLRTLQRRWLPEPNGKANSGRESKSPFPTPRGPCSISQTVEFGTEEDSKTNTFWGPEPNVGANSCSTG